MNTALLCTGQGSQYVGMIQDLAEKYPSAKEKIELADKILGFDISKICFDGPAETLKETRYTQPALFLHSTVLIDLIKDKIEFSATAGHSIGEYAALYAAGVLSFEDALKLVALRGDLMFKAGEYAPGTMFAVIGAKEDKAIEDVCEKLTDPEKELYIVAANYNSPGQLVVSGSAQHLRDNVAEFKAAGGRIIKELPVSGAFHSPLMMPAKEKLEEAINKTEFKDAIIPVYANVSAKPLTKAAEIKEALILQLTSPVRWTQTMLAMKEAGLKTYAEAGPGKVLQGLVKRTLSDVEILGFDKVEDIEQLD